MKKKGYFKKYLVYSYCKEEKNISEEGMRIR
jgi:hypothetical protein